VVQALILSVVLTGVPGPSSAGDETPQAGPSPAGEDTPQPGPSPSPDPCAPGEPEGGGEECEPSPAEDESGSRVEAQSSHDLCGQSGAIVGTEAGETHTGTAGNDIICGMGGDDTLIGMGGDDILFGGDGDDILEGGEGSDYLNGGAGTDTLNGGPGPDTCRPLDSAGGWDECEAPRARDGKTSTRLDLTVIHGPNGSKPTWRFMTRRTWSRKTVWDDGFFLIFVDMRGGSAPDKFIMAKATRRGFVGHVYRIRSGKRELRKDRVTIRRPNRRSIVIQTAFSKIGLEDGRRVYRWYAMSIFNGQGCRRGCYDAIQTRAMFPQVRP